MEKIRTRVFAVIDTNVIVSILLNHENGSTMNEIGKLIESGNVIPLYDERMLSEYYSVLNYSKFHL